MKKFLIFFLTVVLLAACSNEIPEHHQPVQAKRTILAYLVANNNLDGDLMDNVKWMYESLATAKDTCTLLIYYKPNLNYNQYLDKATILEFRTNGFGEINNQPVLQGYDATVGNILAQAIQHTADPGSAVSRQAIINNLSIMQEIAPSQSYGLIFGSHASGWLQASRRVSTYAFGDDGGYSIEIPELGSALTASFPQHNLDFTLFDACMMGTTEVFHELRNATHYCIASVMETPAMGFPYHLFLTSLYEKEIDYAQLCKTVIDFNKRENSWGTYAVVDCTKMDDLTAAIRQELSLIPDKLQNIPYEEIQQYGVSDYYKDYRYFSFDVADIFRRLNGEVPASIQQALAQAVIAKECITDCTISPFGQVLRDKNRFCGIGMYLPYTIGKKQWDQYYETLSWYQAAGWNNLKH